MITLCTKGAGYKKKRLKSQLAHILHPSKFMSTGIWKTLRQDYVVVARTEMEWSLKEGVVLKKHPYFYEWHVDHKNIYLQTHFTITYLLYDKIVIFIAHYMSPV